MRRSRAADRVYLLAVLALAVLFAANVLSLAFEAVPSAAVAPASAGRPRDIDMDALRRRLREGRLSTREARHARPLSSDPHEDDGR